MPNIKSAKKRVKVTATKNLQNQIAKSELKTAIKKMDAAAAAGDKEAATPVYKATVKAIDQAVTKGLLHKNTAARKKSSVTNKFNAIG